MNQTIFHPVESADLLEVLRIYLRSHDPEYPDVEKACQEAVLRLKAIPKSDSLPSLVAYITAEDERIAACCKFQTHSHMCPEI